MRFFSWLISAIAIVGVGAAACGGEEGGAVTGTDDGGAPGPGAEGGVDPADGSANPTDGAAPGDASPAGPCAAKSGAAGDRTIKIMSGGTERSFVLHVPAKYDATKRAPLVFLFHGYSMSAAAIATATHFNDTADKRGMIVAYPDGTGAISGFNAGECCGAAVTNKVDDVGFTRDMLALLEGEYCVDTKRVFSTGFSNGGFLSYRLACEMGDKIAAIAPVAGVISMDPATCTPKRPVPVLHIHGTGDSVVPYNGGGFGNNRSVTLTVDAFKTKNTCATGAGKVVFTKGDVSCTSWSPCTANAEVQLCAIAGGGHQWPGGDQLPYGGSPTPNLNASEAIATFFDAHPLP